MKDSSFGFGRLFFFFFFKFLKLHLILTWDKGPPFLTWKKNTFSSLFFPLLHHAFSLALKEKQTQNPTNLKTEKANYITIHNKKKFKESFENEKLKFTVLKIWISSET